VDFAFRFREIINAKKNPAGRPGRDFIGI